MFAIKHGRSCLDEEGQVLTARRIGNAVMITVAAGAIGSPFSPEAAADAAVLQDAVATARGSASCGPLRYDPIAEHAAEIVNRSTEGYVTHTARIVPADSKPFPMPILKDLGSKAGKAISLQGAAVNDTDAIKGVLLEGHELIRDCSYTDFGVSLIRNSETGYTFTVAVLAGP